MQVVFHCGVHGTDLYRMVKTLMQNRDWLLKNGIEALTPNRHRDVMNEALGALKGRPATPEMEQVMLDVMLVSDNPRRVICSTPTFLGKAERAISAEGLYAHAGERMRALANLFPNSDVEFFVALRNPATLLPYIFAQDNSRPYAEVMAGIHPENLRWAPAIRSMLAAVPDKRLVIWCNEDTTLIWPEVVRRIATMPSDVPLKAGLQVLADVLQPEGMQLVRDEIAKEKHLTIEARRRIFADALEKYALPDQMELPVNLPGWTQDLIDDITEDYETDIAEIAALSGVEFIMP